MIALEDDLWPGYGGRVSRFYKIEAQVTDSALSGVSSTGPVWKTPAELRPIFLVSRIVPSIMLCLILRDQDGQDIWIGERYVARLIRSRDLTDHFVNSSGPPQTGPYAPPFGANPGALTHLAGPYQNPFSPQPGGGGANYFGQHNSGQSTPGAYVGHDMVQYPQHHGFNNGYPGAYMHPQQHGGPNFGHHQHYAATEPSVVGQALDPETEKKLMILDEMMRNQKLSEERAQRELVEKEQRGQFEFPRVYFFISAVLGWLSRGCTHDTCIDYFCHIKAVY